MNEPTRRVLDILNFLSPAKEQSDGGWLAKCVTHKDNTPSLSIRDADNGGVVLYCHAGCKTEDIVAYLGLKMKDLFPDEAPLSINPKKKEIVATYDYTDEQGNLLYQVVRYFPKDFRQRRPDGNGGWIWKLDDTRRVLYNLKELCNDKRKEEIVYVVEGEKDCEALAQWGLLSTTNVGGAGKWRPEYSHSLRSRRVVVLSDNDEPGRDHAHMVRDSIASDTVTIIALPDLPPKGDVSDWIAKGGGTLQELSRLVEEEEKNQRPGARWLDIEREANPIDWIVPDWIAARDIVLLAGRPGGGKSTTATDLAIAVAGGRNGDGWMGLPIKKTGPVFFFDEEAGEDEIRRQFQRQGGKGLRDLYVSSCAGYTLSDKDSIQRIEHEIKTKKPVLIILDTAQHFWAGSDENNAMDVSRLFLPLFRWRETYGITTLIIHHLRKPPQQGHDDLLDRVRGSSAFTAQASTVWSAVPAAGGACMDLTIEKRRGGGGKRSVRIKYHESEGDGLVTLTAIGSPVNVESELDICSLSIRDRMKEKPVWRSTELVTLGSELGHSQRTVERTISHMRKLGVIASPKRGQYELTLLDTTSAEIGGNWRELE